jgi:DNA repair protein RadC
MKKMMDLPAHDRPREKIAKRGVQALTDTELIEAIIGRGVPNRDVRAIAHDIALLLGGPDRQIRYKDLLEIGGMGPTRAAQIMASLELGRRRYEPAGAVKIQKPEDILQIVNSYREKPQEHFICISLSGAGEVIQSRVVTIGTLNHSLVHPREVFAGAITDRAASVICVHNHPSGSLEASPQDVAITRQLQEAGAILGIQLLDHIIITRAGFSSLKEKGLV